MIDLRLQQLINQLIFLVVGKFVFHIPITWVELGLVLIAGVIFEHILLALRLRKKPPFSTAALSTAFNTAFMLGATQWFVYVIAVLVGLLQKHTLRIQGQHFHNPGNVAIVAGYLIFPQYTFGTALDWGNTIWFALLIFVLGMFLLRRVGLWTVSLGFILAYASFTWLFEIRHMSGIISRVMTGTIMLYATFMVTDPKSLPHSRPYQLLHVVLTAFIAAVLPLIWGPKDANLFVALLSTGMLVPIWRWLEARGPVKLPAFSAQVAIVLLVPVAVFYTSKYNFIRNLDRSGHTDNLAAVFAQTNESQKQIVDIHQLQLAKSQMFNAERPSFVLDDWSNSQIFAVPGNQSLDVTRPTFVEVKNRFSNVKPLLSFEQFADDDVPYAPLAVADLNRDGWLDILIGGTGRPLGVFINLGNLQFVDLAPVLFDRVPTYVDHILTADLDGDRDIDLALHGRQLDGLEPNGKLYFFDQNRQMFRESTQKFGTGKTSIGGMSVYDLNQDGFLDFYASFGLRWDSYETGHSIVPSNPPAQSDELWISNGPQKWEERIEQYFQADFVDTPMAGMTALFTDFNQDGVIDFLLGNDFDDPSFAMVGVSTTSSIKFEQFNAIENNTIFSMSYFPIDMNNDGIYELWENGISYRPLIGAHKVYAHMGNRKDGKNRLFDREIVQYIEQRTHGEYDCERYTDWIVQGFCKVEKSFSLATKHGDLEFCADIPNGAMKARCIRHAEFGIGKVRINPADARFDPEEHPKQMLENVILMWDPERQLYRNLKLDPDVMYTGTTWGALTGDVDNNGLVDIYITNSMLNHAHDLNRLLMNFSSESSYIHYKELGAELGVQLEQDSRGGGLVDLDHDGDLDLVVNNFVESPMAFENQFGGRSLSFDLRAKGGNHYAIGAMVYLRTNIFTQVRSVQIGGQWNTSQSTRLHFGVPENQQVEWVKVIWPDGQVQKLTDFRPGYHYVIYQ